MTVSLKLHRIQAGLSTLFRKINLTKVCEEFWVSSWFVLYFSLKSVARHELEKRFQTWSQKDSKRFFSLSHILFPKNSTLALILKAE